MNNPTSAIQLEKNQTFNSVLEDVKSIIKSMLGEHPLNQHCYLESFDHSMLVISFAKEEKKDKIHLRWATDIGVIPTFLSNFDSEGYESSGIVHIEAAELPVKPEGSRVVFRISLV